MPDATPLEKMRAFVASYPDADILSTLQIDYTDQVPEMAGIFPQGLVETSRRTDILGNTTVGNQLNFALYTVLSMLNADTKPASVGLMDRR